MKYLITLSLFVSSIVFADAEIYPKAQAQLKSLDGKAQGVVSFQQLDKKVKITVEASGLDSGKHGFHVHEYGDCSSSDGTSAGGHFVGTGVAHAGPESESRHAGDLGNIIADNNQEVKVVFEDEKISLTGENNILGRSVVIHAEGDDMTSQPSGAAGSRVACGVIGLIK